jgi:putative ABC transport system permease protein
MGKTVHLSGEGSFTVTGVLDRDAYCSHLPFDALYSFGTIPSAGSPPWDETGHFTYLRLGADTTPEQLAPTLQQVENQYFLSQSGGISAPERFPQPDRFALSTGSHSNAKPPGQFARWMLNQGIGKEPPR